MEAAAIFTVCASLGAKAGAVFLAVWNQERFDAGLDTENDETHDTDKAIRIAVNAVKLLIEILGGKLLSGISAKVDYLITVCADQVLQVVAEVSERLGLPCYIDFATAENVSKKSYMKRIFEKFGAIYYGCCDRLDDRLDIIDTLPNVRKISCSPWSDREHFAAVLPKKYIMSNKPNPSYLAQTSFDEDVVRADLRRTIKAAKANGLCLEFLLKDITTVCGEPRRLWRWSEIALEETQTAAL